MGGKARTLFQAVLWGAALWASGGGAVALAPYLQGVAVAYGAWAARDAAKRSRSALNAALQDRQIIIRSASAAKNFVSASLRSVKQAAWLSSRPEWWSKVPNAVA